jgi:hypothetical protein
VIYVTKYRVVAVKTFYEDVSAENEIEAKYKALEQLNASHLCLPFVPEDIECVAKYV